MYVFYWINYIAYSKQKEYKGNICAEENKNLVIKCTNVFWISWYVNTNTAFAANSIGVRVH